MNPPQSATPHKTGIKIGKVFIGVFGLAVIWIFVALIGVGWLVKERKETIIISGGPFYAHFDGDYYPPREQEIAAWFKANIPAGSTRTDVDRILSSSFSKRISSDSETTIDRLSNSAGGQDTKVRLVFDAEGGFKEVTVNQHWAFL